MSFWTSIGVADYDEQEDKDKIAKEEMADTYANLPIGKIVDAHSACDTCGHETILGNGLCMKCWDYVVDNSSANAKNWPDASQYLVIKARQG